MQPSLPFARITTDAWRAQVKQTAAAVAVAVTAVVPPPPRRPVGRPKRALTLDATLIHGAAAAAEAEEQVQVSKKARLRGKYTSWFDSPYINDILRAYQQSGYRASVAVAALQKGAPDDRYQRLSHSSLTG